MQTNWIKVAVSAVTAGIISGAGAAITAFTQAGDVETVSKAAVIVAILTGLVSAAKDIQSFLTAPPTTPTA